MSDDFNKDELLDKYINMAGNRSDFDYINPNNFLTPTMGEMIQEDLMAEILQEGIDKNEGSTEQQILEKSFYTEAPIESTPGYYPEHGAFVLKAKRMMYDDESYRLNKFDGDTTDYDIADIEDGGKPFTFGKHGKQNTYKSFKDYFKQINGGEILKVRHLAIDAPEIPHYEKQPVKKSDKDKYIIKKPFKELKKLIEDKVSVHYEICPYDFNKQKFIERKDEDIVTLYKAERNGETIYHEVIDRIKPNVLESKDYETYVLLNKDESESNKIKDGYEAQRLVKEMLTKNKEIILVLNASGITVDKTIAAGKTFNSFYYVNDTIQFLLEEWNRYYEDLQTSNYTYKPYGTDKYGRSLGVIYVKDGDNWINLNKYILAKTKMTQANPDFNGSPELQAIGAGISDSFNIWSYNKDNVEWLDSFSNLSKKSYDDRLLLHKKLTGIDFVKDRECALLIGDTMMMVPPESIVNVSKVAYERIPNMRSKGTMAKQMGNNENLLEISLYFYEDIGINGIPYKHTTPAGVELTYYMNGLRSLLAQFKISPFLPIENGYINDVLGIEAISLENINIQNVQGFPRLLKAVLTVREFNYRVFMPDLPIAEPNETEDSISTLPPMFAKSFDWHIFRYYYQRSIAAGEKLDKYKFASYEYNLQYYKNKNSLMPWHFCGEKSNKGLVSFYIPDEEWLTSALTVKKQRDSGYLTPESGADISEEGKEFQGKLAMLGSKLEQAKGSENFKKAVEDFINYKSGTIIFDEDMNDDMNPEEGKYTNENIDSRGNSSVKIIIGNKDIPFQDFIGEEDIDGKEMSTQIIEPMKNAMLEILNKEDNSYKPQEIMSGITVNEKADFIPSERKIKVTWEFKVALDLTNVNSEDFRIVRDKLSTQLKLKPEDIFVDNSIRYNFVMEFKESTPGTTPGMLPWFVLDKGGEDWRNTFKPSDSNDILAIKKISTNEDDKKDDGNVSGDSAQNQENHAIDFYVQDYKNPANMPFVPYIEDVLCSAMTSAMTNSFTDISLKAMESYAPQYLGGQDMQLEMQLITDDATIVTALSSIPNLATSLAKKYRRILPAWPIKIKSDFTNLLGISEVLIDQIEVFTMEGYPGVYTVTMRMTSVDRTQRQREAMRRLDVAPVGGKTHFEGKSDLAIKDYFAIEDALSKVELYPDLDLPTLNEMAKLGYRYVKYTGQNRSYPDPDFYIVYAYPYTSLLLKKMVKDNIAKNLLTTEGAKEGLHEYSLKDVMGGEVTTKIESGLGITLKDSKGAAKTYKEIVDELRKKIHEKSSDAKGEAKNKDEEDALVLDAIIKKLIMCDVNDGWEIKPGFRATLADDTINKAIKESIDTDKANAYAKEIKERRTKAIKLIDEILSKPLASRGTRYDGPAKDGLFDSLNNVSYGMTYSDACIGGIKQILYSSQGIELVKLLFPGKEVASTGSGVNYGENETDFDYVSVSNKEGFASDGFFDIEEKKSESVYNWLAGFLYAAGCSLSGSREFRNKVELYNWRPNHFAGGTSGNVPMQAQDKEGSAFAGQNFYMPYCVEETTDGKKISTTMQNAMYNGVTYGAWRVSTVQDGELIANVFKNEGNINYMDSDKENAVYKEKVKSGFIDSYYNKLKYDDEELLKYRRAIMQNKGSNAEAFFRIVLMHLKKMLLDGLLISEIDIMASDWEEITSTITEAEDDEGFIDRVKGAWDSFVASDFSPYSSEEDTKEEDEKTSLKEFLDSVKASIDRSFHARLIYPFVSAATNGNRDFYQLVKSRSYDSLNAFTGYTENTSSVADSKNKIIKFMAALSGIGMTSTNGDEEVVIDDSQKLINSLMKDIYIQASEDPRQYLLHSFYDMLVNDKRGRLVRAFPTYYVIFVDEGRKIGSWKLHDNFYNMNSISSIQVVKSRKIAADTCTITMNNMFNSYTREPDITTTQQYVDIYGLRDVFDSIFSPETYFEKEKMIRMRKKETETTVLQPGVRIHVRIGYSADGAKLPIVFNGKIAEVEVAQVAQIVAQGDGHELMNPLNALGQMEANAIDASQSYITWFRDLRGSLSKGGESPRDLLMKILTAKQGGIKKAVNKVFDGRWYNDNAFGIMHFGDPKCKHIFEQGEVVQNLYEVSDKSLLKGVNQTEAETEVATPTINTSIQDKTFWDLLHLAAGTGLEYVGAIRDFGFRSSIFLGKRNQYYAYKYVKVDGKIVEKRKPFQQFHYYDSYTDIIYNSIKASDATMKTNAVGLWQSTGVIWGRNQDTVGPIYLDMNIYPEFQKSMTVDTGLLAAGDGGVYGSAFQHFSEQWSMDANDEKVNKETAWRVTANALRDSVKEMYQGDLGIIGDPSVKPHDRMYVSDSYEDIMGQCEVEAVVHTMSVETGFTTSIMPDVIARHGDKHEIAVQSLYAQCAPVFLVSLTSLLGAKVFSVMNHGKLISTVARSKKLFGANAKLNKIVKGFYNSSGIEESLSKRPYAKSLFENLGVLPSEHSVNLEKIDILLSTLGKETITDGDDILKSLKLLSDLGSIDIEEYKNSLKEAYRKDRYGVKGNKITEEKFKESLKEMEKSYDEIMKHLEVDVKYEKFVDEILKVDIDGKKIIDKVGKETKTILEGWKSGKGDLKSLSKVLDDDIIKTAIKDGKIPTSRIDDVLKGVKTIFTKTDDVTLFGKVLSKLKCGGLTSTLKNMAKGLMKFNMASILIDIAISCTISIITKNAQEAFSRFMKGVQAIDVYPMKKNGRQMIAGMNGNKGSVYGFPVSDGYNSMQGMIMQAVKDIKDLDGDGGHGVMDWLVDIFVDEGVYENMSKEWMANLGIDFPDNNKGEKDQDQEELLQSIYGDISSSYSANSNHYYSILTKPRAKELTTSTEEYNYYKILNVLPTQVATNPNILKLVPVSNDDIVSKAMLNKKFTIAHNDKPARKISIPFESGTALIPTGEKQNGNYPIIDMPLVQDEIMYVIRSLLLDNDVAEEKLVFKSGIKVNEDSISSTGYVCLIEAKSGAGKVKEALENIKKESNIIKDSNGVFDFSDNGSKFTITAYPPIITNTKKKEK